MHSFFCNDTHQRSGSLARAGRWYFYARDRVAIRAFWSFWSGLKWSEVELRFGGEDSLVRLSIILPWLVHCGFGFGVPRRWLSWWMLEDRVFAIKVGYVGAILRVLFAVNAWGVECGMIDYYRRALPRKHTDLQLWPGVELVLRLPLLDWILGRAKTEKTILFEQPAPFQFLGDIYDAKWSLERWATTRTRWPWPYRIRVSSYLEVPHPPKFAGKGESGYDCDDDGIFGMGSMATTPDATIVEYCERVLVYRSRYGKPSEARFTPVERAGMEA